MKIIVLHGEDTTKSYARLMKFTNSAKERGWEIIYDTLPNTPSLFGTERLIIYKDFRLLTKNDIKNFAKFDGTLVIYHTSDLPVAFIKQMPSDFKMEKYELPKLLFTFLESLYPGNGERAVKLLHAVIEAEPIELVFFFIARHFRDLYWVGSEPETTGFPSWKLNRLKSQAGKFTLDQMRDFIGMLAEIDIKVKRSEGNLVTHLDLFLIKSL